MEGKNRDLPAIEGGKPVRTEYLPFFRPSITPSEIDSVVEALRSAWLTLGPLTGRFEDELAAFLGAKHVAAVSSCSAAMFLGLKALGVGPGDEVITSANTFASTVHAIIHAGATPVLADIEPETFGPSPQAFESKTTANTRAYLPVHFGGQACRIEEIIDLAKSRGVAVLEDAAHSFGAEASGRKIGTLGDATAFSFYATKNLTCGEGGCLSTADADIADRFRELSYHGISHGTWQRYTERGSWYYEVERPGYKYNMSDLLSSLGLAQLRRIDELLDHRRRVAEGLLSRLDGSPLFRLPKVRSGNTHTWHLFVILLELDKLTIDRDQFVRALAAENIGCSVHFIPIYHHPFFKPYRKTDNFPVCDDYFPRCISLPIFPEMSDDDIDDVVGALNRIAIHYAKR